ncbi:hypothetical protein TRVL_07066 [Trypanosoma vivax]|nr:hypothetical protein TRVL_07066 [Trypanosoma vivax]
MYDDFCHNTDGRAQYTGGRFQHLSQRRALQTDVLIHEQLGAIAQVYYSFSATKQIRIDVHTRQGLGHVLSALCSVTVVVPPHPAMFQSPPYHFSTKKGLAWKHCRGQNCLKKKLPRWQTQQKRTHCHAKREGGGKNDEQAGKEKKKQGPGYHRRNAIL